MGLRHCRIRLNQRRKLIEYFVMAVTGPSAADVIGVHPNTTALFYHKLREVIAENIADDVPFNGEIKMDESDFGGGRKGKRGRGAAGKVPVFDLIKNFWNQGQAHLAKTQWHPLQKLTLVSEGM